MKSASPSDPHLSSELLSSIDGSGLKDFGARAARRSNKNENPFWKSKPCLFFTKGECKKNEEECSFSHDHGIFLKNDNVIFIRSISFYFI